MTISVCSATVAQQLRRNWAGVLNARGADEVRLYLRLSLAEMGMLVGQHHPGEHRGKPYHRSAIWYYENGRPMPDDTREAYRLALEAVIQSKTGRPIILKAKYNRAGWRFWLVGKCSQCERPFTVPHLHQFKCNRCLR